MKITLAIQLKTVEDGPVIDEATQQPVTLRMALVKALLADLDENGAPVKGDAKIKRYDLYLKIKQANGADELELTPEEATLLRQAALAYPTLIAGQVRAALA